MKIQLTKPFEKDYRALPQLIKNQADKQFALLLGEPHHPSLRIKKIKGHPTIWAGRITKSYRFTFETSGDVYLLRRIGTHDILKTP